MEHVDKPMPPKLYCLASFLGLPIIRFLIACSMQKWRGEALVHFIILRHQCLGRQGGRGPLSKERARASWRPDLVVSAPSAGFSNICEVKSVPLMVQN